MATKKKTVRKKVEEKPEPLYSIIQTPESVTISFVDGTVKKFAIVHFGSKRTLEEVKV